MPTIYYLPGRGESVFDHVGKAIQKLGFNVFGRDLLPDFINYNISQQLEIIKKDVKQYISEKGSALIARSYGAFLLLQSLSEMPPFPGKILLFSPVLGPSKVQAGGTLFFRPPRADKLISLARESKFPTPNSMEIHTGSADLQCHPSVAEEFSNLLPRVKLSLVRDADHHLEQEYVKKILKDFLSADNEIELIE